MNEALEKILEQRQSEFITGVASNLRSRFPSISTDESQQHAQSALAALQAQGDEVLYRALTSLGVDYAAASYERACEGPVGD